MYAQMARGGFVSIVKSVKRFFSPESMSTFITCELSLEQIISKHIEYSALEEIIKKVAEQYAEQYAPEILKRIQNQVIDSKVIQKVIENLRKELKSK